MALRRTTLDASTVGVYRAKPVEAGEDLEGYSALLADLGIAWLFSAVAAALPYGHVR
jgi:hypothetical protein